MLPTEALSLPSKGCFRRAAPNSRPCSASVKHFYPTVSTNLHMVKNRLFQISTHPPSKTLGLFQQMEKYFKILKGTSLIPQFWLLLKSCIKIWLQGRVKRGAKGNEQKAKGVKKKKPNQKKRTLLSFCKLNQTLSIFHCFYLNQIHHPRQTH